MIYIHIYIYIYLYAHNYTIDHRPYFVGFINHTSLVGFNFSNLYGSHIIPMRLDYASSQRQAPSAASPSSRGKTNGPR